MSPPTHKRNLITTMIIQIIIIQIIMEYVLCEKEQKEIALCVSS